MVVFDATILLALLQSDCPPPRHPETNEPIDSFRERIDYLIKRLDKDKEKIIIPTPALSEILVRADSAFLRSVPGDTSQRASSGSAISG